MFLALPAAIYAQEATITGTVTDSTPRMLQLAFRATF